MERWELLTKRADFAGLGARLGVDQVIARVLRNRDLTSYEEMYDWLYGGLEKLHDPYLLKDCKKAAERILWHIAAGHQLMIANDFDCDGISSGFILENTIRDLGGNVYVDTPDRIADGYGINERMVEDACEHGVDLIITCDNGIAAFKACECAKKLGIEVIITDHHEVQFTQENGEKNYLLPEAYAVIDPKQEDCPYPYKGICGAVVAFKLMQVTVELSGRLQSVRKSEKNPLGYMSRYLEVAAMATVADVMELRDENRVLVKHGLLRMRHTDNLGLAALMEANSINPERLSAFHIGFVIGPCLNASGRLSTAKKALALLNESDPVLAKDRAVELKELNDVRKDMTAKGVEKARLYVEEKLMQDKVLIVLLEDCHESLAGIIAGRIREYYNKPTIVLTDTGEGYKGSGRSIQAYDMFSRISKYKELCSRFGGHAMACGLSLPYENLEIFRNSVNADSGLTEKDLVGVVKIDIKLPVGYLSENLINSLELLGPFGNGNSHPLFADTHFQVMRAQILGQNRNVLKLDLMDQRGYGIKGIYFGDIESFDRMIREHYGNQRTDAMYSGRQSGIELMLAYEPSVNEFRGVKSIEIVIKHMQIQP